ncbi:hypothetical protein SAMN02799630_05079 [Paenibacillus sp. UNCCL117]|uniref:hypothetical protein n=1 Tax=unclassified Paenibacillus TaxID=185978 RepID=UPI000881C962|nr:MULTISPECIES: hypothetical protein [unclassified Paenibacillus]SDE30622.1 hypothetical protein SAMN04488602_12479 [Paenibacillus sp. cl123]SFW63048.1 hypothetical protein SAMN02799630_05079 [Paenibacillus sp. UNCCL117]
MSVNEFLICFFLLMCLLLFLDKKHWRTMPRGIKRAYVGMYIITLALYMTVALGIDVPMPTRFFINQVSPWVFSIVHP